MAQSVFHTAYQRILDGRERQASRYVAGALLALDDRTLEGLGTSRKELRRNGGAIRAL